MSRVYVKVDFALLQLSPHMPSDATCSRSSVLKRALCVPQTVERAFEWLERRLTTDADNIGCDKRSWRSSFLGRRRREPSVNAHILAAAAAAASGRVAWRGAYLMVVAGSRD